MLSIQFGPRARQFVPQLRNAQERKRSARLQHCQAYTIFSPSKVNLFLRITRRRDDGYHDLASLFHVIDLGDTLSFEPITADCDSLQCNMDDVPTDKSNLVIKALDLFRKRTGTTLPMKILSMLIQPHMGTSRGGNTCRTGIITVRCLCHFYPQNESVALDCRHRHQIRCQSA